MSNPFDVVLTPADLLQPPAPSFIHGTATAGTLEFYGPGNSGAVASPSPNLHAEVSGVFGSDGP